MEQKTLIQYLVGQLEHERVAAVAELVYQTENYVRALAVAITGLSVNANPETISEFSAVRRNANEVTDWLESHRKLLDQYANLSRRLSGAAVAEAVSVPTEAQEDPAQTLH